MSKAWRSVEVQHRNRCTYDFDGVLHPTVIEVEPRRMESVIGIGLFGWLPALVRTLQTHPDVGLVVHSTWRYTHDPDELRLLLGGLGKRMLGAAPRGPRYESILWWLHLNPQFTDHRILDDDPSEFPRPLPTELIVCNPEVGVTSQEVAAALRAWLAS